MNFAHEDDKKEMFNKQQMVNDSCSFLQVKSLTKMFLFQRNRRWRNVGIANDNFRDSTIKDIYIYV